MFLGSAGSLLDDPGAFTGVRLGFNVDLIFAEFGTLRQLVQ